MLSYIADINTSLLLQNICKRKNILILNEQNIETDLKQYIKETKVNFNLIKYLFIDLRLLQNTEQEIIENLYNFSRVYARARIIIFAPNFNEQDGVLTKLYDLGFYNIINEFDSNIIESKLNAILDFGLNKKDSKRFEKREEIIQKESRFNKLITKVKQKSKIKKVKEEKTKVNDMPTNKVYLFSLLLEAVIGLIKFIGYILVYLLTSIGLTVLLNSKLREIVFQILGLE